MKIAVAQKVTSFFAKKKLYIVFDSFFGCCFAYLELVFEAEFLRSICKYIFLKQLLLDIESNYYIVTMCYFYVQPTLLLFVL